MTPMEIRAAMEKEVPLYFCEVKGEVRQVVECRPISMEYGDGFSLVGVVIPAGLRVAVVDGFILGRDAYEAQIMTAHRSRVFMKLSSIAWEKIAEDIVDIKKRREANPNPNPVPVPDTSGGELN